MKKAFIFLLILLLLLTGCTGKNKNLNVSVKDTLCPYKLQHKKDTLRITLKDGQEQGLTWQVKAIPEGICQVTPEEEKKEYVSYYGVAGVKEGAAQLTFTALQEDQTVCFTLNVIVDVDGEGKVTAASVQHKEREHALIEAEDFTYEWNVDLDGVLNFNFVNSNDLWSVSGDGGQVCSISDSLSTPSGCRFSARAEAEGQTTIILSGETTQRRIAVLLQVDEEGKLEVLSVQEQ